MSLYALSAFLGRFGGIQGLLDLRDKLNKRTLTKKGPTQTEVAQSYEIDPGQFSHFVHDVFNRPYLFKPEIEEYLCELEKANHERLGNARRDRGRIHYLAPSSKAAQEDSRER